EARECRVVYGLHFMPHAGERAAADHPKNAGVGPLAAHAARAELALEELTVRGQTSQHGHGFGFADAVTPGGVGGGEGRVRAGIAEREIADRIRDRLE